MHGHADWVTGVSYSPDGRRIASASLDGTIKLWDATTGQEILTLRGHASQLFGISYSPDGRTLLAGCYDGTLKVWDATSLTPELQVLLEARSAVEFFFTKLSTTSDVLDLFRKDQTMTAEVRALAAPLAESFGSSVVVHQAERIVNSLYAKAMLRPEVLAGLRDDSTLREPVRGQALALAQHFPENARSLDNESWRVASAPGADPQAYDRALRLAEAACRLVPHDGNYLNTLARPSTALGSTTRPSPR